MGKTERLPLTEKTRPPHQPQPPKPPFGRLRAFINVVRNASLTPTNKIVETDSQVQIIDITGLTNCHGRNKKL